MPLSTQAHIRADVPAVWILRARAPRLLPSSSGWHAPTPLSPGGALPPALTPLPGGNACAGVCCAERSPAFYSSFTRKSGDPKEDSLTRVVVHMDVMYLFLRKLRLSPGTDDLHAFFSTTAMWSELSEQVAFFSAIYEDERTQ